MTNRATATVNGQRLELRAREMSRAEFDATKATYRDIDLRCANPNCAVPVYPRLSVLGNQLFAHMPGTGEQCPERAGEESETHQEGKHLVVTAGEAVGLRAEVEYSIDGRRADVALFRADRLASHGPVMLNEVQHSPLPVATYDARETDLSGALRKLDGNERRAVVWWTTFTPGWGATRPHMQVDIDSAAVVSGLYRLGDLYGDPIEAPMHGVIDGVLTGTVFALEDRAFGTETIRQWAANPAFSATGRRKRRTAKGRAKPDDEMPDCVRTEPYRPLAPELIAGGKPETRCEADGCRGFYKWAYIAGTYRLTPCGRCGRKP